MNTGKRIQGIIDGLNIAEVAIDSHLENIKRCKESVDEALKANPSKDEIKKYLNKLLTERKDTYKNLNFFLHDEFVPERIQQKAKKMLREFDSIVIQLETALGIRNSGSANNCDF